MSFGYGYSNRAVLDRAISLINAGADDRKNDMKEDHHLLSSTTPKRCYP